MTFIQRIKLEIRLWRAMRDFKKEIRRFKLSSRRKTSAPDILKAIRNCIGAASEVGHD